MNREAHSLLPKEDQGELVVVPFTGLVDQKEIHLCLNVQKIIEVREQEELAPLPVSYRPFVGLFDHRNGPIPILDVNLVLEKLDLSTMEDPAKTFSQSRSDKRIIFCHLHHFSIGLLVNRTKRIEAVRNDNVLPLPGALVQNENHLFNGLVRIHDSYAYMLDIESILDQHGVKIDVEAKEVFKRDSFLNEKRILVVEDSELFRKKAQSIFENAGASCVFAHDGQAGIDLYKKHSESIDLIFTDIEMPIMNGIEMARKLRETQSFDAPIIFNSSIANPSLIAEIEGEGLGSYIVKFNEDTIFRELRKIFKG